MASLVMHIQHFFTAHLAVACTISLIFQPHRSEIIRFDPSFFDSLSVTKETLKIATLGLAEFSSRRAGPEEWAVLKSDVFWLIFGVSSECNLGDELMENIEMGTGHTGRWSPVEWCSRAHLPCVFSIGESTRPAYPHFHSANTTSTGVTNASAQLAHE
ncbi:hypothetical protein QAD02_017228 [Eretmocerus hayati]|uniref:Uncharacterized protein n=1 Tax=Eretmocerus hayati TaxID=131215 RepID=A0ACC2PD98_9HYME|nr:hypothetical protein QAD02_017228 [Eretmocerus hayati]